MIEMQDYAIFPAASTTSDTSEPIPAEDLIAQGGHHVDPFRRDFPRSFQESGVEEECSGGRLSDSVNRLAANRFQVPAIQAIQ